jgi:hypothetical protein
MWAKDVVDTIKYEILTCMPAQVSNLIFYEHINFKVIPQGDKCCHST